jgi:hypothetical protein
MGVLVELRSIIRDRVCGIETSMACEVLGSRCFDFMIVLLIWSRKQKRICHIEGQWNEANFVLDYLSGAVGVRYRLCVAAF